MCDVIKHLIGGHQFSLRYGVAMGVAHQKQLRRQIGQPRLAVGDAEGKTVSNWFAQPLAAARVFNVKPVFFKF